MIVVHINLEGLVNQSTLILVHHVSIHTMNLHML